ncbi:hypothetical protein BT93_L1558 [Corymbia citriodora subsp. variegata]|uniref:EF-hand domain-containing protein n=1 Tax=Corymbia citriodora subsp. variegata TaxID=360336 RepID=A0A8T0CM69_CORYI|nr:hypothetical protein BT93_L1558 [Corymbia citriodora subsp. variegata]
MGHLPFFPRMKKKSIIAGTVTELKDLLRSFDTNGDGRLNHTELKNAFEKLGSTAPQLRALQARLDADENGDGCINEHELNELLAFTVKHGHLVVLPEKRS